MRYYTKICSTIKLLTLVNPVFAQTIKVGYVEFFPYTYTKNNTAKGYLVELARVLLKKYDLKVKAISMPAK